MPARINYIIPSQKFELIAARIGEILIDEFDNQLVLTGNYDYDVDVTVEGNNPYLDKVELPNVNISLIKGKYGNKNQGSADGVYQFAIDAYATAKTTNSAKADYLATKKVQRILGMVRVMLEDPQYKTLGYSTTPQTSAFIMRTGFTDIDMMEIKKDDVNNVAGGRLTFQVTLNESVALKTVNLIDGYDTTVKLGSTDLGYFYQGENY